MLRKFSLHSLFINHILYNVSKRTQDSFSINSYTSTYLDKKSIHSGNIIGALTFSLLFIVKLGIKSRTHLNSILK